MNSYDVIIIGGGVSGVAISRELSRYKLRIALLEKEVELAFGVSKSNSGIIHPGTQNPAHSLKGRLCVQGNRLMRKISRELGVDFKQVGELIVAFEDPEIAVLLEIKKEAQKLGVPGLKIVDRRWLNVHEPNLNREAAAALYAPTAGIISPYRLVYDISENASKNGVEIYTGTRVIGIESRGGPKEPLFEIRTSQETFTTRYLVNAAGLFADEIARMAGVNDITIRPRKGEEFLLDKKREHLTSHLIFPLPQKNSKGVLMIKTADGNPMIGPTAEDVDDKNDLSTSEEGFKKVLISVQKLIPSVNENDIISYFAGLRPVAGNDFIIRHEDKVPGLVTVAGIQSPGLTAAPAIALLVKDILRRNGLELKKKLLYHGGRQRSVHLFAAPFSRAKKIIRKNAGYGDIVCRCEMVSAQEVNDAIARGARTLDGVKFRTRAQAGRCHGSFCTSRIMKIISQELKCPPTEITKRGPGSEIVKKDRADE